MSRPLSPRTQAVYDALWAARDKGDSGAGTFHLVYLDNAKPADMSATAFAGHLGALEKAGQYKVEDGYAWGLVKAPQA